MNQPRYRWRSLAYLLPALLIVAAPVAMCQDHGGHSLGTVNFPVSCTKEAQIEFNRAVALLHHMTYPAAKQSFQKVAEIDPSCAMAHWGIAMTLFQPLWPTRPGPADLQQGWSEVQKAKELKAPTERERLFVDAAFEFFREPESANYWDRIQRWEQALSKVYSAYPRDPESTAFYALALLATAPQDKISREHADHAAELLMSVYRKNPDHPGAMHYLIHANDVPGREHEFLEIVRKYETIAPQNPHALHMPTHIYTRIGDWDAVIRGNIAAADAALKQPAGDHDQFVWDEFPHAIEYLIYAYLQKGDDALAAEQLQRLLGTKQLQPSFKTAFHLASTQARYALERREWREAAALVPREPASLDWDKFAWPEAITWFAKGFGAAHLGDLESARHAVERMEQLEGVASRSGEELFARNIRILRLMVQARIAQSEANPEQSVAWMHEAVELEATTPKHPVTPGPTLPASEVLGDLLMEQANATAALDAYKRSLEAYPHRLNSLLGATRAAHMSGNEPMARTLHQELLQITDKKSASPRLKEARAMTFKDPPR